MTKPVALLAIVFAALFAIDGAWAQEGGDDPAQLEAGMAVFEQSCASCHMSDGTGSLAGRSLIDIATIQPDRAVHTASVTDGLNDMPSFAASLSAEEIDVAVTYARLTFVSEQPASEDDAQDELAVTGTNTTVAAFGAGALLVLGLVFLNASRNMPRRTTAHPRER
jgi:mono/diheme cytochrome c family protein